MSIITDVLSTFTRQAGLQVNCGKSGILLKGTWLPADKALVSTLGFPIVSSYKYLGILLGHVTPQEFFFLAVAKANKRAFAMCAWNLSFPERVMLFKLWVLPLLMHPVRVIFPTDVVVSSVTVYWTALRMTSWTITSPIFSLPQTQGGFSLPDPKAFLYQQHSVMFTHFIRDESSLPRVLVSDFQSFCQVHGITFQGHSLQTIQMGSKVVWRQMPYLAWSMLPFPF